MSDLMASIGRVQLSKIEYFKNIRQNCVYNYIEEFSKIPEIGILKLNYQDIIPHIFSIKILNGKVDLFRNYLLSNNIQFGMHYQPCHTVNFYKTKYNLHSAEKLHKQLVSIPLHPSLTESEVNFVIEKIKAFFTK